MLSEIFSLFSQCFDYLFDWFVYLYAQCGIDIISFVLVCFGMLCVLRVLNNGIPSILSNHKLDEPSKSSGKGSQNSKTGSSNDKAKEGD